MHGLVHLILTDISGISLVKQSNNAITEINHRLASTGWAPCFLFHLELGQCWLSKKMDTWLIQNLCCLSKRFSTRRSRGRRHKKEPTNPRSPRNPSLKWRSVGNRFPESTNSLLRIFPVKPLEQQMPFSSTRVSENCTIIIQILKQYE